MKIESIMKKKSKSEIARLTYVGQTMTAACGFGPPPLAGLSLALTAGNYR